MNMENKNFLQMFADAGSVVNGTAGYTNAYTGEKTPFAGKNSMSSTMKTYYDTELLENARPELIYAQLGRTEPMPAGRGKTVEWRKWNTLPNAGALQEGVIPTGEKFGQSAMTSAIGQFGMYVTVSDELELHAVDDVILGAAEELAASAGQTQDRLVRDELMTGTNVLYAVGRDGSGAAVSQPKARWELKYEEDEKCLLTPDMVNQAATWLKKLKAPRIDGKYVAVIHPSVAYDLRGSQEWIDYHQYAAATELFSGEIGELHGVRFVESTQAPVLVGEDLGESRKLTAASGWAAVNAQTADFGVAGGYVLTIGETPDEALVGREILCVDAADGSVHGHHVICGVNSAQKLIFAEEKDAGTASGDVLLPGEGGFETAGGGQNAVYATMFFGKDAFGLIDPDGAGMEMIIHPKGEVGGPLDQFSTVGYKFSQAAKVLYNDRLVRVESCSAYSGSDTAN